MANDDVLGQSVFIRGKSPSGNFKNLIVNEDGSLIIAPSTSSSEVVSISSVAAGVVIGLSTGINVVTMSTVAGGNVVALSTAVTNTVAISTVAGANVVGLSTGLTNTVAVSTTAGQNLVALTTAVASQVSTVIAVSTANILSGFVQTTATTGSTVLLTIPAGRTWVGQLSANVTCTVIAASTVVGSAEAIFLTVGAGATPAAGNLFMVDTRVAPNAATGTVSASNSNSGTLNVIVAASTSGNVTINYQTFQGGTTSDVQIAAFGQLL